MKKHILRAAIAAPFIAATLGAPAAAFAEPADEAPADDSATITIPGADEVDLSDIGDSTYEVTADWGKGEIIADATTKGDDGTGGRDGEALEPETKPDEAEKTEKAEKPDQKTDEKTVDESAPKSESADDESDESAKTTAEDGSDSPAEDAEDETKN